MDNTFSKDEKLFRAVYPPNHPGMFWKRDGSLSSAAFADRNGLSVDRRGEDVLLLNKSQRNALAKKAVIEYMEV